MVIRVRGTLYEYLYATNIRSFIVFGCKLDSGRECVRRQRAAASGGIVRAIQLATEFLMKYHVVQT